MRRTPAPSMPASSHLDLCKSALAQNALAQPFEPIWREPFEDAKQPVFPADLGGFSGNSGLI